MLELYNIEDKKILILVPTEQGILIRPTQAKGEENALINHKEFRKRDRCYNSRVILRRKSGNGKSILTKKG